MYHFLKNSRVQYRYLTQELVLLQVWFQVFSSWISMVSLKRALHSLKLAHICKSEIPHRSICISSTVESTVTWFSTSLRFWKKKEKPPILLHCGGHLLILMALFGSTWSFRKLRSLRIIKKLFWLVTRWNLYLDGSGLFLDVPHH